MPAAWQDFLQESSWGGFEIDVLSVHVEGSRTLDKREYPDTVGAEIVDKTRNALTLQLRAVFFEDAYPERYQRFLAMLAEGGVRELVHPVHGRLQAAVEKWSDVADPEDAIDHGEVDVTFVEHTANALGPFEGTDAAALANLVRSACDDVDTANNKLKAYLDSLESPSPDLLAAYAEAPGVSASFASASSDLEADGDTLSQSAIQSRVDASLSLAAVALGHCANIATPEARDLNRALVACCARLARLGEAVLAARPPLIEVTLTSDVPLLAFAHARYGDSARAAEILLLNAIADPVMLRAGQTLVIYAA